MSSIEKAMERLSSQKNIASTQHRDLPPPTAREDLPARSQGLAQVKRKIQLNLESLAQKGYLTLDGMHGSLAEQYRHLKRPLLKIASGRGGGQVPYSNLIALTSALQGEGKTFTAFNLGMSIAMERDISVLLVDSDLVVRSLTNLVGLEDAPGLTDVLIDSDVSVAEVIVGTDVPKLSVIPAGRVRHQTTELLASERMRELAHELSTRYSNRVILFDTAPILITSQALVLDALVGQVVVVVEEGKTSQNAIKDAVSLLEKSKDVGIVLNKSRRFFGGEYCPYYGDG